MKWLKTLSLEFRVVEQLAVSLESMACNVLVAYRILTRINITTDADQKHKSCAQMPSILEMIMASGKGTIFCLFSMVFLCVDVS